MVYSRLTVKRLFILEQSNQRRINNKWLAGSYKESTNCFRCNFAKKRREAVRERRRRRSGDLVRFKKESYYLMLYYTTRFGVVWQTDWLFVFPPYFSMREKEKGRDFEGAVLASCKARTIELKQSYSLVRCMKQKMICQYCTQGESKFQFIV